ncbi:uncharacterized protein ARMOST_17006 [Armillaria ostoyae]|uniref:F-box domain-containing protein n=1 Tax=Armillaria ostoyae TaxID=47428 RepID=A0A284RXS6_ARMOS|nr:uncharacterized protein ARMOST_17006 [Armillaria ostoyae]
MGVELLSFDVLGDIFAEICEATDPKGEQHIILCLSSVCSAWRKAALAYPMLWSNIYLRMLDNLIPAEPQERLLAVYIERSRTAPLSIIIRNTSHYTGYQMPFTTTMYALLHANAHRWQKLDIVGSFVVPIHLYPFLSPASRNMGMLQSLKCVTGTSSGDIQIGRLFGLHEAPNLRILHFNMHPLLEVPGHRGPPYPTVKDMIMESGQRHVGFNHPIEGLTCLRPFTNLERLVVVPSLVNHGDNTIQIPSLTSLTLCIPQASQGSFGTYLCVLRLPSLRSLVIIGVGGRPVVEHQSIAAFTRTCCSSLRNLIIDEILFVFVSQGLIEILNPFQELRHLTVREPTELMLRAFCPISQQFARRLLDDSSFLPKLTSVDIHLDATRSTVLIDDAIERRALHKLDSCEASSMRRKMTPQFELEEDFVFKAKHLATANITFS